MEKLNLISLEVELMDDGMFKHNKIAKVLYCHSLSYSHLIQGNGICPYAIFVAFFLFQRSHLPLKESFS